MQYGTAQNINELYDSVDPEPVLSLLVHKVIFLTVSPAPGQHLSEFLFHIIAQRNMDYNISGPPLLLLSYN